MKEFFKPGGLRDLLAAKLKGIGLYRILPHAVYYLDNRRGFGHRERLDLPDASVR